VIPTISERFRAQIAKTVVILPILSSEQGFDRQNDDSVVDSVNRSSNPRFCHRFKDLIVKSTILSSNRENDHRIADPVVKSKILRAIFTFDASFSERKHVRLS